MARDANVELLQGTLDLLILKTLSWGPSHGYGVARWIQQSADDVLRVEEGSLYPALHRLERAGVVTSEWGFSENNRRARFYRLTRAGQQRLRAELTTWNAFAGAVAKVLAAVPDGKAAPA